MILVIKSVIAFCYQNMNEMYPCINRNARPNNNQLITYYLRVSYSLRIIQYPVDNTYNKKQKNLPKGLLHNNWITMHVFTISQKHK